MLKTRVIPTLLLKGRGLVKTVKFKKPTYLGDPINVVKILNEKEVDELILLDITATKEQRKPDFDLVAEIVSECFMPVCYGGGVRDLEDMKRLFAIGIEKVAINTYAVEHPEFVRDAAEYFASQSVVVAIDVKKNFWGSYQVYTQCGQVSAKSDPVTCAVEMQAAGAGEIFLNSIDLDGTMQGYDLPLIAKVAQALSIPVIASGGAGKVEDFLMAVRDAGASAVAAGSLFVFEGVHRAVLITYPDYQELEDLFSTREKP
jgi:cyclase